MTPRERGNFHLARSEWTEAAESYREAAAADASDARIYTGLGFALCELGDREAATDALTRATSLDAKSADAHYLLGRISHEAGQVDKAIRHFEDATACASSPEEVYRDVIRVLLDVDVTRVPSIAKLALEKFPQSAEFCFYLAVAEERVGDVASAIRSYERTCALQSGVRSAHLNLGRLLVKQQQFKRALPHLAAVATQTLDDADLHVEIGNVHVKLGDNEAAVASYTRSLELRPNAGIAHIVACLTGETPDRAPDEYVAKLFDEYADEFESHLVGVLKYNTPRQLRTLIDAHRESGDPGFVLDLGCGTGLMGVQVRDLASHLVGVDLSSKMLRRAEERKIYDRLVEADLSTMMASEPDSRYELVAAADVLVYIGKLDVLFSRVYRLLRPAGLFAFSVEAMSSPPASSAGFQLHAKGRYVHSREYLTGIATKTNFEILDMRDGYCRENEGVAVASYDCVLRRAS